MNCDCWTGLLNVNCSPCVDTENHSLLGSAQLEGACIRHVLVWSLDQLSLIVLIVEVPAPNKFTMGSFFSGVDNLQVFVSHGRNSVTTWPVVPILQVTIVPVPIRCVSSQTLRFLQRISSYHGKYLYLWCKICPWYWSNIRGTFVTIKHHFELYNIESSGDSFCAHLVMVLPVLRHDCARTTHPAVTVLPVLRVVLYDSI